MRLVWVFIEDVQCTKHWQLNFCEFGITRTTCEETSVSKFGCSFTSFTIRPQHRHIMKFLAWAFSLDFHIPILKSANDFPWTYNLCAQNAYFLLLKVSKIMLIILSRIFRWYYATLSSLSHILSYIYIHFFFKWVKKFRRQNITSICFVRVIERSNQFKWIERLMNLNSIRKIHQWQRFAHEIYCHSWLKWK